MRKSVLLLLLAAALLAACRQNRSSEELSSTSEAFSSQPTVEVTFTFGDSEEATMITPQTLLPGEGVLKLAVTMPYGYKLNQTAPLTASIKSNDRAVIIDQRWADFREVEPALPVEIPMHLDEGTSLITLDLTIYWCEAIKQTLCFVDRRQIIAPMIVSNEAHTNEATVEVALVSLSINQ